MYWTDIHCHLNMLETTPQETLTAAAKNNVKQVITIATNPEDLDIVFSYAKDYGPQVFCTQGIHPHDAKEYSSDIEKILRNRAPLPEVVAIGEIGLDYFYKYSDIDIQKTVFEEQLKIAKDFDLPIQIHSRDAEEDTVSILKKVSTNHKGVVHCFTGTDYLAEEALKLGLNISISGIVTFKNAHDLRETISKIPIDRIHIETDAPFLAPVPQRGKKNQPAFVLHTAEFVANLFSMDLDKFNAQILENNLNVFPKLAKLN